MAETTQDGPGEALGAKFLDQVPIEITVSVGKARPLLRDLLRIDRGGILPLDRRIDDPVELYIGDRLIARGELQEVDGDQPGQIAVRLTEVIDVASGD
ncbi:flagellar motor switch protein FliN/FliY [Rhodovulum sp. ES.010]|uniref:FliM/FliN family flagellar motor switch protein n=1 Tax=Rhodovulum sp. ES.010 TaxID=1882821 RepID=UPI00092C5047|nr:FliM/FliN family flagellar motor switch protein [Rhodovulum sp. ES.010]SIO49759.1 flagellar motor switch protein FliN/FliY [Rhodovulum sp. ES.010]